MLPIPAPGVNPNLDEAGTHFALPRVAINQAGALVQLWAPVDWSANVYEWREVPIEAVDPAPTPP